MAKNRGNVVGSWAFLIGFILAVIVGLLGLANQTWTIILVALGIIVGLLNITAKETNPFLMSGAVLIIASALGQGVFVGVNILQDILAALLALFVPATIVVSIKNVFGLARD